MVQQFFQNFLIIAVDYSWHIWLGRKPIHEENKENTENQINGNHLKQWRKTNQQRQLTEGKHSYDLSSFYGVVVSTFDFESKDPSSTLGGFFSQLIFDDVDCSCQ